MEKKKLDEIMKIPKDYKNISNPKLMISKEIKNELEAKHLSIRQLAKNVGMKHPQIIRVTSVENYNIDTLLKILAGLDLEIVLRKRKVE